MMDIEKLIETLRQRGIAYMRAYGRYCSICDEVITALFTLQAENARLRAELERMKKIMRDNGIMTIPPKYPGGPTEWNIPKPRNQKEG